MAVEAPVEALPQTQVEWEGTPPCPEVVAMARDLGVTEVVHFTRVPNAVGVFASALKSRARVHDDRYLEHVYRPNAPDRSRDSLWLEYVNLSISRINDWFFGYSKRWHPEDRAAWVILSFGVELLGDPGVVFATTNNAYPECLRARGLPGFLRLFDEEVVGYGGRRRTRGGLPLHHTTDRHAEVLYPGELPLSYLQGVYAETEDTVDDLAGALYALRREVRLELRPEAFQ